MERDCDIARTIDPVLWDKPGPSSPPDVKKIFPIKERSLPKKLQVIVAGEEQPMNFDPLRALLIDFKHPAGTRVIIAYGKEDEPTQFLDLSHKCVKQIELRDTQKSPYPQDSQVDPFV